MRHKEVNMAISKEAYNALESVVGARFISDDPAICEGYRSGPGGYEGGLGYERVMTTIPAVVILPRNTEDVQRIVKICNRYKVPYVPYSTGFYGPRSHCHVENELLIDLKRLNDFEIDEKHLYRGCRHGRHLFTLPAGGVEARRLRHHRRRRRPGVGHRQPDRRRLVASLPPGRFAPQAYPRYGAGSSRWRDREDGFSGGGR